MPVDRPAERALGTMVAYGFPRGDVGTDLALAVRMGASCVEILPDWGEKPDARGVFRRVRDTGLTVHSVHGCWGGRSIEAVRVDLGSPDDSTWRASVDDLKRCLDWLRDAGGRHLVVHPGGLSNPEDIERRTSALKRGLEALADHAGGSALRICVENMPPGVHPGSKMSDLKAVVDEIGRIEVGLAIDTGHAHMTSSPAEETRRAGERLWTTHVHDNNGRQDTHEPPGGGSVDWESWGRSLDEVKYEGPVMLECIRRIRQEPERIDEGFLALMGRLTNRGARSS